MMPESLHLTPIIRSKAITNVSKEPMYQVRPDVAKQTRSVLHTLLQNSPSASYESIQGPVDHKTFRFMKSFRKLAAKTFRVSAKSARTVASHLDEIGVHSQVQESKFTTLDKAGHMVKGFWMDQTDHRRIANVRTALEQVTHRELIQEIDPSWELPSVHSAAAAVFQTSQFDSPMLWRGLHLLEQEQATPSPAMTNLTSSELRSNHTEIEWN